MNDLLAARPIQQAGGDNSRAERAHVATGTCVGTMFAMPRQAGRSLQKQ